MIGMRARARSAGGKLRLRSSAGQGVLIDVRVPAAPPKEHAEKDTHLVSG